MARKKKTMGRRANGEGSLYQRQKDQRWIYEIKFRGESKPHYFSGMTSEEAIKKKDEALEALTKNGFLPKKNNYTVGQWMDTWLQVYKASDLTDSGRESYEDEINLRIKPGIGNILLSDLTNMDVQKWINKLNKNGRKVKKTKKKKAEDTDTEKEVKRGLAPKTVVRCWGVLRQALDKAVEEKLITSNPAEKKHVNLPKIPKPQINHMNIDDAAAFLEAIKDDYMYPAIMTDLMTGLRRGELLGLKWKDIDFKKGTLKVRRELIRRKDGPKLEERVKTDNGYRELELPPRLINLLQEHKKQQLEIRHELREKVKVIDIKQKKDLQKDDLVFCWPDGRFYSPDHLYKHLQRLLKKHGFERLSVHGLRHTYATAAISSGVDLAVLSKELGHADKATTTIYLHSDREREKAAAIKVQQAFLGKDS